MAIQVIPIAWAVLGRGVAAIGSRTVTWAVKKGAKRAVSGTLPVRVASLTNRAFSATDIVYTGAIVADYFTDEPLVKSEVGRTVMDMYGMLMLTRLGYSGARSLRGAPTKVAKSSEYLRATMQRKYSQASVWVRDMPRLQGSLKQMHARSVTGATRTWTKVFDTSKRVWFVMDRHGRPLIRMSKDGFDYVRTDKVAMRNVALAGGSVFGAKLMFDFAAMDFDDDGSTDSGITESAKINGAKRAIEVTGEYLDFIANALYPDEDDYSNDGDPSDFIRRLLMHPNSTYREIAYELGTGTTSTTVEDIVLGMIRDAINALTNKDQEPDEAHTFVTDSLDRMYDETEVSQNTDDELLTLPEDDERAIATLSRKTDAGSADASMGDRGAGLFRPS